MGARVLVIEDDVDTCELVAGALRRRGFDVETATRANDAHDLYTRGEFDAVATDVTLDQASGLDLCRQFVAARPDVPVVIMTGHGDLDMAVDAIRAGAYDFINKPIDIKALTLILERATEHKRLRDEVKRLRDEVIRSARIGSMIGESKPMRQVFELVGQVATTDVTVLITGESGTGKELVARAIHERSDRADGPMVAINCAAMPASLLESELFGHVKGAFTDARQNREGLLVRASGGTLFLDEIGEMPIEMQAKLLRVLQERKVRPVGGDREVSFDVRIVCATNQDLADRVDSGEFREDLYFRINVVGIAMPPLRSRGSDILLLAQNFLDRVAARSGKEVTGIAPAAAQKLLDYGWPGNVRELENCIERAVTLTRMTEIEVDDLPPAVRDHESIKLVIAGDDPDQMPTLEEMERRYLRRVLDAVRWNKSHAARVLGMDRRTLYRKLERHEIDPPE